MGRSGSDVAGRPGHTLRERDALAGAEKKTKFFFFQFWGETCWDLPDQIMGREEAAVTANQEQRATFFINVNTTNVCA